jgi:hypothetical protein
MSGVVVTAQLTAALVLGRLVKCADGVGEVIGVDSSALSDDCTNKVQAIPRGVSKNPLHTDTLMGLQFVVALPNGTESLLSARQLRVGLLPPGTPALQATTTAGGAAVATTSASQSPLWPRGLQAPISAFEKGNESMVLRPPPPVIPPPVIPPPLRPLLTSSPRMPVNRAGCPVTAARLTPQLSRDLQ